MEKDFIDDLFDTSNSVEPETVEIEETAPEIFEAEEVIPEEPEAEAEETLEHSEPEPVTEDRKNWAPVSALTAEREKTRQKAEEASALRKQLDALQTAQRAQNVPDPYENPTGYQQHQDNVMQARIAQAVAEQNLVHSRIRAEAKYGKDVINEVADWAGKQAEANPLFQQTLFAQADPAEWVIEQKKRSDELDAFTSNRDAFIRAEAAKLGFAEISGQPVMEAQTTQATKKPNGPKSIVHSKSRDSNRTIDTTEQEDLDAIFNGRK